METRSEVRNHVRDVESISISFLKSHPKSGTKHANNSLEIIYINEGDGVEYERGVNVSCVVCGY